jgi:imidazolonepropionase
VNLIREVWADELVSPSSRGLKRFAPARLLISKDGRVLSVEKISTSKLKHASKKILRARALMPGLIDAHTHLVFAGDRASEWAERLRGVSYQEIAKRGGGILKTLVETREASRSHLTKLATSRLKQFLSLGVTTLEIKSGYGLSLKSELKLLQIIRQLKQRGPQRIFSTFMGAHAVPKEFATSKDYIDHLISAALPRIRGFADFQDVFCERGYFSKEDSLRLLKAGRRLGLRPKVHAHEFERSGGVEVAAKVGAVSADHLMEMNEGDFLKLKRAKVVPVLLPGTSFFLGAKKFAKGRRMFDLGLEPAIASDFNPGTNPTLNLPLCGTMAAIHYSLSLDEVLRGQTLNAARALGQKDIGALEPGYQADFICLEANHFEEIYYSYGNPLVASVYIGGKKVY